MDSNTTDYYPNFESLENENKSFDFLKISLASPEKLFSWCLRTLPNGKLIGEIKSEEAIDTEAKKPVKDGLFCQSIFGPIKNWKCACGKAKGISLNKFCDICDVELTETRVRRYRMGFISIPAPICHFWYFGAAPNYLLSILRAV